MKIKFILILLLLNFSHAFSQTPAQLVGDTKNLYVAFDEIDIDKLSTMLLSVDEPTTVYGKLDEYFLNDEKKFRYVFTNAKYNFGPVLEVDGKPYCAINFRNVVRITYFKTINVANITAELKIKFNAVSVVYENARNSFMVVYNAKMIASQTGGVWQFAFIDETIPKEISGDVISENAKKALGF